MDSCSIEVGLLRKKPCGHAAVAHCVNCEQPLCVEHAVAQLTESGSRSGKFMCQACVVAAKDHAKSMAAVHQKQEQKKLTALENETRARIVADAAASVKKKPVAPTPPAAPAPAPAQAAPAEAAKESGALEFTPKDGKLEYSVKKDESGFKPD